MIYDNQLVVIISKVSNQYTQIKALDCFLTNFCNTNSYVFRYRLMDLILRCYHTYRMNAKEWKEIPNKAV